MAILMTGATGFLGRYLLERLLEGGEEIFVLMRGQDAQAARERLRKSLAPLGSAGPKRIESQVTLCLGSLDRPNLGLSPKDREKILASCDSILHCGANVRFDLPLAE